MPSPERIDPESADERCEHCGAGPLEFCNLGRHTATLPAFAAYLRRERQIDAAYRAMRTP